MNYNRLCWTFLACVTITFGQLSIAEMIPLDPGVVGDAPTTPNPLTTSFLVGQSLTGQQLTVDLNFTNDKFVTYSNVFGVTSIVGANLQLDWEGGLFVPNGGQLITAGFLDEVGDFQTFGSFGGPGTGTFEANVRFPPIVLPETFSFYGLRFVFTLPDDPTRSVADARLNIGTTNVTANLTVGQVPEPSGGTLVVAASVLCAAALRRKLNYKRQGKTTRNAAGKGHAI